MMKGLLAGLIVCLALLLNIPGSGQVNEVISKIRLSDKENEKALKEISYIVDPNRGHNLFLEKEWQNTYIVTENDERLYFRGRYNVLNNVVEANINGEVYVIIPSHIKAVVMNDRILVSVQATKIGLGNFPVYLEVLSTGKLNLLIRYIVASNIDSGNILSYQSRGNRKYLILPVAYYTSDYDEILEIKPGKKSVLTLFGDKAMSVEKFIRNNRLNVRQQEDLKQVFDFYNQIESY